MKNGTVKNSRLFVCVCVCVCVAKVWTETFLEFSPDMLASALGKDLQSVMPNLTGKEFLW